MGHVDRGAHHLTCHAHLQSRARQRASGAVRPEAAMRAALLVRGLRRAGLFIVQESAVLALVFLSMVLAPAAAPLRRAHPLPPCLPPCSPCPSCLPASLPLCRPPSLAALFSQHLVVARCCQVFIGVARCLSTLCLRLSVERAREYVCERESERVSHGARAYVVAYAAMFDSVRMCDTLSPHAGYLCVCVCV